MKKILAAFAIAAFAVTASANVAGSSHNLGGTVCGVCHVAHWSSTAVSNIPLWNPSITLPASGSYTLEAAATGGTLDARGSLTCLACHTNVGTYGPAAVATQAGYSALGTDLSNDHPVGSNAVMTFGSGFQDPAFTNFTIVTGDAINCASCHDVHQEEVGASNYRLLRDGQTGFCTKCHTK